MGSVLAMITAKKGIKHRLDVIIEILILAFCEARIAIEACLRSIIYELLSPSAFDANDVCVNFLVQFAISILCPIYLWL